MSSEWLGSILNEPNAIPPSKKLGRHSYAVTVKFGIAASRAPTGRWTLYHVIMGGRENY